jgi:2-polyprenyl-3-methyl-5-hydroxy-6-metoxy-1,4-benzoquinol methylase
MTSPRATTQTATMSDSPSPDRVEVVTDLERLDVILREVDLAGAVSDDALRAVFATFRMAIPDRHSANPWSAEYRDNQFDLYHRISSRPSYSTDNEVSGFRVDPRRPFPYYTESSSTVGDQLLAIGYIIKTMALPTGSSILEFGPGWGNTTIALSRMGYDVTALDIDPNFVQLIKDRAALFDLPTKARVGAFLDAGTIDEQFDAVLFYECFHHCSDHVQLLADLHRVVKPGGKVVLAAEPIFEGFHAPWGLRLDGESLWAIRKNGWLELGFTESYFTETCIRQGWNVHRNVSDVSALTSIFTLTRLGDVLQPGAIRLPPADEAGWAIPDGPGATPRYTTASSRLPCPVGRGDSTVHVDMANPAPTKRSYVIRHGDQIVTGTIGAGSSKQERCNYDPTAGSITFESDLWCPAKVISGSTDRRRLGVSIVQVTFS